MSSVAHFKQSIKTAFILVVLLLITACGKNPPGIGEAIKFSDLAGWSQDKHAESWPALIQSCKALEAKHNHWRDLCDKARQISSPSDTQAREFYEKWFVPYRIYNKKGNQDGLITGYFDPLLQGSLTKTDEFKYPVYQRPDDMVTVELSSVYPQLKKMRLRGKVNGTKLQPYYTRAQIEANPELLKGKEIAFVKDRVGLFFLHIQGSGRIELPNKEILSIGYADQNGHPYVSIGKVLVTRGEMDIKDVTAPAIYKWLQDNPGKASDILNSNPSYIFFSVRDKTLSGPLGSLGVPLTSERSIAVDRSHIPLGMPVWLETELPKDNKPYKRLMFAQDTGGAISGEVRADVFWGQGDRARFMAGHMKQKGKLYVLLPKGWVPAKKK